MAQMDEGANVRSEMSYSESEEGAGRHPAQQIKEKARQRAVPFLSSRKERLVEQLNETAEALRETGTRLDSELAMTSAEKIEELGGYLGGRDIDELLDDLQHFARSRPWLIMGAAFVTGLAAARFLKASGREQPLQAGSRRTDF